MAFEKISIEVAVVRFSSLNEREREAWLKEGSEIMYVADSLRPAMPIEFCATAEEGVAIIQTLKSGNGAPRDLDIFVWQIQTPSETLIANPSN